MPTIALEKMQFFAHHGVTQAEQDRGNWYWVDVYLQVADISIAAQTDNLQDTINYAEVYDLCKDLIQIPSKLLEPIVQRILSGLGTLSPQPTHARVRVSKLNPPVGGKALRSFVEDERIY
ncbi:MAG: dihydroneopterin aldolase [Sphingobacteriales bacterium]|jgi:dihydroneopterin aldolase|nr:dihydroneopterin aldolase [Sphingobacteriales bacterium]MBP9140941.1 dihydroneopterin aldolase [Chitinophagales bacterium]MDA0198731.1 dihydroneopterin aldolase [Bacteroidota bacterium]MBK6889353.1 dihydroneopterin aldolase [Sphingobacteriales bacterium]MBK7528147.1 dihydroneopterin aldolase [Sphingobacteriales bacterium]